MNKLEIRKISSREILFAYECENNTAKRTVLQAIKENINLSKAILSGIDLSDIRLPNVKLTKASLSGTNLSKGYFYRADLSEVDFSEANLQSANLFSANLRNAVLSNANLHKVTLSSVDLIGADLSDTNLYGAELSCAQLCNANLENANLYGANLIYADLQNANLSGANLFNTTLAWTNLSGTNLSGANLYDADLSLIKEDFQDALKNIPREVFFLRKTLIDGEIDGRTYGGNDLDGIIAKSMGLEWKEFIAKCVSGELEYELNEQSARETWFMGIKKGDTPENSQIAKITLKWIEEILN